MIRLPDDITNRPEDIDQWCSRGVIMALRHGQWEPHWYIRNDRGSRRTVVIAAPLDGSDEERTFALSEVAVHWPRCGAVNIPQYRAAAFVQRLTRKQYCRTYTPGGTKTVFPRAWDVARALGYRGTFKPDNHVVARAVFDPGHVDYDQAERRITSEDWVSVALTPRVIVAGDKSGKRMFYYNNDLVATMQEGVVYQQPGTVPAALSKVMKHLDGRYAHVVSNQ